MIVLGNFPALFPCKFIKMLKNNHKETIFSPPLKTKY